MSRIPRPVKTSGLTLALVSLTFIWIAGLSSSSIAQPLLDQLPTLQEQAGAVLTLITLSVLAVRSGSRNGHGIMWLLGVLFMQLGYGILGVVLIDRFVPADPIQTIVIVAGGCLTILTLIMLYGFASSRSFRLWEVYAVLLGFSAGLLGVAATRVRAIWMAAAVVALIGFLMYIVHIIARFKRTASPSHKNAVRLYVSITGAPVELVLFLLSAILNRII